MSAASKLQSSPEIPVVQFPNRQRQGHGRSELRSLKPVVDAANFTATSMMASVLHHAMPRMLAINVAESLFLNDDGSVNREAVKSATGALWIVPAETDDEGNVPDKAPVPDVKQLPASNCGTSTTRSRRWAVSAPACATCRPTRWASGSLTTRRPLTGSAPRRTTWWRAWSACRSHAATAMSV
jgi:hypothetical protein